MLTNKKLTRLTVATGCIIFVVSGWAWWTKVHNSPTRVFWGMVDTSLSTASVATHIYDNTDGQIFDRDAEVRLGTQNIAHVIQTRTQNDATSSSTVVQETIGTIDTDYLRFPYVSTGLTNAGGRAIDYSSIQGVWGKTPAVATGQKAQVQNFNQAVLGTVPFANLLPSDRKVLAQYIRDNRVYVVDPTKTVKKLVNGKQAYEYTLQVNAKQYFTMLQEFAAMLGIGPVAGIDPSKYDDAKPLGVKFTVAITSRQLLKIYYADSNQDEMFDSYGVRTPINPPSTTIPLADLEKRIQSL